MRFLIVALFCALSYAQTDDVKRRELQQSDGVCTCIGIDAGTSVEYNGDTYPLNDPELGAFGATCAAWDMRASSPWNDQCSDPNIDLCGSGVWCLLEYCYVDPNDPDCEDVVKSTLFPDAYYSYTSACTAPDCYTCTYDEDVECSQDCRQVAEDDGRDCDCPVVCVDGWVGDQSCDRRDVNSCYKCNHFWESGSAGELTNNQGTCDLDSDSPSQECLTEFDEGDCLATTTLTPGLEALIAGPDACVIATPICPELPVFGEVTIEAVNVDASRDGIDYGCLTDDVANGDKVGWFLMRISSVSIANEFGGRLSSINSKNFKYAIWGPYDDTFSAHADCGETMSAPTLCEDAAFSDRHDFVIENANAGEVYILAIADASGESEDGSIVTLSADVGTLDCDIVFVDLECETQTGVALNFTNAYAERRNLGQFNHPDQEAGIYYRQVGFFGNDELSLLVTTSSEDYKCDKFNSNGNHCDTVGTGPFGQINTFPGDTPLNFEFRFDDTPGGRRLGDNEVFDRVVMTVFDIDSTSSKSPDGEAVTFINPRLVCPGGLVTSTNSPPYAEGDIEKVNILTFTPGNDFIWNEDIGCYQSLVLDGGAEFRVSNRIGCGESPLVDSGLVPEEEDPNTCRLNNPTGVNDLSVMELSMAVQAEFFDVGRDGIDVIVHVKKEQTTARNFWFAGASSSIGRTCCKDVFSELDCTYGFRNDNLECGKGNGEADRCTEEFCCKDDTPVIFADPIIHTFHGECYDLHKDGNWLATSHPEFDHDVHIAVYNEYVRQVSITNKEGDILLAINNLGEILNNDFPYHVKKEIKACPEDYDRNDCIGEYVSISFDAQDLYYDIHAGLRHDYNDNGLLEGQVGFHMDVWPQPYVRTFNKRKADYTGVYFFNPLPGELETCTERYARTGQI